MRPSGFGKKYRLQSYLLYVGINKPHKNFLRLVKAWKMLVDSGETGRRRLVIAGPWDPRYPEPMQHADRLGMNDLSCLPARYRPVICLGCMLGPACSSTPASTKASDCPF